MRVVKFVAKLMLLSSVVWRAWQEMMVEREERALNFNNKYSEIQVLMSPYAAIPWPRVYGHADDILLCWAWTKIFVALLVIFKR